MEFIINNLFYDTEKMEKIADVLKWRRDTSAVAGMLFPGKEVGREIQNELWKSKKGNWLLTYEMNYQRRGEAISEEEAKDLMKRYAYKKYIAEYGTLEEA